MAELTHTVSPKLRTKANQFLQLKNLQSLGVETSEMNKTVKTNECTWCRLFL
jgi:hypothetical protein